MWRNARPNKDFCRLYPIPIPIIAITGGIGCGKSLIIKILKERNFPVISADVLIKKIYQTKSALTFISKNYPNVLDATKKAIDFSKLRKLAFDSKVVRDSLEVFLYPQLQKTFLEEFQAINQNKQNKVDFIFYEIPLLFEKNLQDRVDKIICIGASEQTQIQRTMQRDQTNIELAKKIIEAQMPLEEKKKNCDIYFYNNAENINYLESLIEHLIYQL